MSTLCKRYCESKQTLNELSQQTGKSVSTLQRYFHKIEIKKLSQRLFNEPINLLFDATFFSRTDGVLVFRANQKNLHWSFVESETLRNIAAGLDVLEQAGYQFKSFTIDGRKGVIQLLNARYPEIPIQLCHFHQVQMIRRYTTNNPKTQCGKALLTLIKQLTLMKQIDFVKQFVQLREYYADFLKERNDNGEFVHRRLRAAYRSLKTNLPYLFTCQRYPELSIPNTTNSCDGSFAHWKQKIKIHRGLAKDRCNKMINYLLTGT